MPNTRVLTQAEREAVLDRIKPTGGFKSVHNKKPVGMPTLLWEEKLGDLNEYREHKGMGRAIVPVLTDPAKTQSVQISIATRLRRLFPKESWTTYVEGQMIFLKFNGDRRVVKTSNRRRPRNATRSNSRRTSNVENLFAETRTG